MKYHFAGGTMHTNLRWTIYRKLATMSVAAGLAIAAGACWRGRGASTPDLPVTSLTVRNLSFFDVNIYVLPFADGGRATRVGTVVGGSSATFPLHRRDLMADGALVLRVHAIGARGSWTSDAVSVGDGVMAVLDVHTDPFGDCSTSSLRTIVVSDSVTRSPFGQGSSRGRTR